MLFNVRSRYFPLSVYQEYLALEGGPPVFTPDFTRLALLWNSLELTRIRIQACHLVSGGFPTTSTLLVSPTLGSKPRNVNTPVWADPISLAATYGISVDFFSSGY